MAERILSDDEQAELARGFERIEIDKMGPEHTNASTR